jgi:hypothetical protein
MMNRKGAKHDKAEQFCTQKFGRNNQAKGQQKKM